MLFSFINYKIIIFLFLIYIVIITFSNNYIHHKYRNIINVAYAFDKNYHYITHVSMKSIMLSQNNDTFINFYILVSNITLEQKNVINRISIEHKNCKIEFFDMGNEFKEYNLANNIWSTANFYRLRLTELLKDVKKIIYLDTDTLIYKDLSKIYNYNIEGKYFIGMLENKEPNFFIRNNVSFNNFINTGVMLCNLEEIKAGNISYKIIEFIKKNNNSLLYPVNEPTNLITYTKNDYFSPEDVVIGFCNIEEAFNYYDYKKDVNKNLVIKAYKDPYIYHYIMLVKPWNGVHYKNNLLCVDPFIRFYEVARKTSYFYEILKLFPIRLENKNL